MKKLIAEEKKMTDQEKDKLIVEALGECWHEWKWDKDGRLTACIKCKKKYWNSDTYHGKGEVNLATWGGFGWCQDKLEEEGLLYEYWRFVWKKEGGNSAGFINYLNPTRGRDAIYEFLSTREI